MCIFREGFFWVDMEARLLERFHGFFRILLASPSHEVAVVAIRAARDIRSTLGSNVEPCPVGKCQLRAAFALATGNDVTERDHCRSCITRMKAHYSADMEEEEERITSLVGRGRMSKFDVDFYLLLFVNWHCGMN